MKPEIYRKSQLGLSALLFCLAVAVLGCAGNTLHTFNKERSSNPWWLPLWPNHFDSHGNNALIGSAVVAILACIFHLLVSTWSKLNLANHPTISTLLVLSTFAPATIISLITVAYAHILNHNAPDVDTIQTWTCRFKDSSTVPRSEPGAPQASNSNFGRLCAESKFSIYSSAIICGLQGVMIPLAICAWVAAKRSRQANTPTECQHQQRDVEMNDIVHDKHEPHVHTHEVELQKL